jgi:hypothetical protein
MGKIYTVVLNSEISAGPINNQKRFFYDWDKLEQGEYKVSFTFISGIANNPDLQYVVIIAIDLGQSNLFFGRPTNTRTNPSIPDFLGYVESNIMISALPGNDQYVYASLETNPPIYLGQRPTNNTFFVRILANANPAFNYNSSLIGRYTLTLYFEKMD